MFSTYSNYVTMQKSLTFEEMDHLYQTMISEIGNDEDSLDLYQELLLTANRYSFFRSNWFLWSTEKKLEEDPNRTSCHNSLIIKFNQLARYLKMQGKSASWRDELGYEEDDPYNRKRIGDFACYIIFLNSIHAR